MPGPALPGTCHPVHRGHSKEHTGCHTGLTQCVLQVESWAQQRAQHLAASPSLRDTLEQVSSMSQRDSAQLPSVEFLPPPALTSWLLRRTLLFTFVRLTSHVRLGREENRRRMWVLLLPKQVRGFFPVGHRDPQVPAPSAPKSRACPNSMHTTLIGEHTTQASCDRKRNQASLRGG